MYRFQIDVRIRFLHDYLEDVGEITEIEDVVKLDSSGQEGGRYFLVESQGSRNHVGGKLLYWG